jgi:hypothetical protein
MSGLDLDECARRVQRLVAEGRYAEAQGAFEAYCSVMSAVLARLPTADPRWRSIKEDWQNLFDRTRCNVLAGRAHAAARLLRLPKVRGSYGDVPPGRPTWQCSG